MHVIASLTSALWFLKMSLNDTVQALALLGVKPLKLIELECIWKGEK